MNKFIQKNSNEEMLENERIILQHLLSLLQSPLTENELKNTIENYADFQIFLEEMIEKLYSSENVENDIKSKEKDENPLKRQLCKLFIML